MKSEKHQVQQAAQKAGEAIAKGDIIKDIPEKAQQTAENLIDKSMMPKDIFGVSDQTMEGLYGQAYRLYQTGKYKEAMQLFRLLMLGNATESKYAFGMAACFHQMKEYKSAVESYALTSMIDPTNPLPYFHASDCYLEMKDKMSASISLQAAIKNAGNKPEYQTMKDKAKLTLEGLNKELNQKTQAGG